MPTTSSTFIYIGNFADIDTDESDADNENPSVIYQTFTNATMFVTTVDQTDINGDGTVQSDDMGQTPDTFTYDVGGGPVTSGLDNAARYNVSYVDENGTTQSTVVSAYQTQTGDVFLKFPNGLKIQSVTVTSIFDDGFTGITYGTSSNSTVVCFEAATLIDTPNGPVRADQLAVGQWVDTLDNGAQPIRWLRHSRITPDSGAVIRISAGALGACLPEHDLIVTRQHRLLVGGNGQLPHHFDDEYLVPAGALIDLPGIDAVQGNQLITLVHFAFDSHEIIKANGVCAESLLLGPMVLQGLSPMQHRALSEQYLRPLPHPDSALNGPVARPCLGTAKARRLVANTTPLIRPEFAPKTPCPTRNCTLYTARPGLI